MLPERRCRFGPGSHQLTIVPVPDSFAQGLRRVGWLAGLPALALIWAGATLYAAPRIAERLEAEGARVAAGTATETGEPWLRLTVEGRDLVAAGEAPDAGARAATLFRLAVLDGPRRIVSRIGLVETAAPFQWTAIRVGPAQVALEGAGRWRSGARPWRCGSPGPRPRHQPRRHRPGRPGRAAGFSERGGLPGGAALRTGVRRAGRAQRHRAQPVGRGRRRAGLRGAAGRPG